jgi:hypothetical protein
VLLLDHEREGEGNVSLAGVNTWGPRNNLVNGRESAPVCPYDSVLRELSRKRRRTDGEWRKPVRQWALILSLLLSTCLGLSAVAALLFLVAGGQ